MNFYLVLAFILLVSSESARAQYVDENDSDPMGQEGCINYGGPSAKGRTGSCMTIDECKAEGGYCPEDGGGRPPPPQKAPGAADSEYGCDVGGGGKRKNSTRGGGGGTREDLCCCEFGSDACYVGGPGRMDPGSCMSVRECEDGGGCCDSDTKPARVSNMNCQAVRPKNRGPRSEEEYCCCFYPRECYHSEKMESGIFMKERGCEEGGGRCIEGKIESTDCYGGGRASKNASLWHKADICCCSDSGRVP